MRMATARYRALDGVGELPRGGERSYETFAYEVCGDFARGWFLAVIAENTVELFDTHRVHKVGGGDRTIRVHPHVEGAVGHEAEAARRGVELMRRDAEIEQRTINSAN